VVGLVPGGLHFKKLDANLQSLKDQLAALLLASSFQHMQLHMYVYTHDDKTERFVV
jgi:hypothetical protein